MLRIKYFLTTVLFFVAITGISQKINGIVIDSNTKEPLPGASIYFNNTTIGTISNSEGEFSIEYNEKLKTQLIISFVGYESLVLSDFFFKEDLVISLTESLNVLEEVELSSNDNWTRELKLEEFKKHFLGKSSAGESCKILNEEDIILRYDFKKKTLSAKSKSPIMIQNNYLKYLVSVDLRSFEAIYSHVSKNKKRRSIKFVSYNGSNHYRSIDNNSSMEIQKIREQTYLGSTLHFMKSLAEENLSKEGFEVFFENGKHSLSVKKLIEVTPDIGQNGVKVKLKNKLNILYKNDKPSSIKCGEEGFYIDSFGNHAPTETVIFTGDFGNQRMGDSLPLDYFVGKS